MVLGVLKNIEVIWRDHVFILRLVDVRGLRLIRVLLVYQRVQFGHVIDLVNRLVLAVWPSRSIGLVSKYLLLNQLKIQVVGDVNTVLFLPLLTHLEILRHQLVIGVRALRF